MASTINSDNGVSSGSAGLKSSADSSGVLQLQTNGTAAVTVDTSQNVGIGTASPRAVAGYTTLALNNTSGGLFYISAAGTRIATIGADLGGLVINALANMPMTFSTNNTERMRIDSSGNVLVTNVAGLGYGTGSGGTVTQATSKSTAVTLNKPTGQITMNNAALASGANVSFSLNNTLIAVTDILICTITTAANYSYQIQSYCGAGQAQILLRNIDSVSRSEALVINFAIIKGATF